jgi:hypothetical protein
MKMKTKKSQTRITKKRINALLIFIFILLIPMILNSLLLSNINGDNNIDLTENDQNNKKEAKPLLSAPFNAHYFSSYKTITIDYTQVSGTSGLINFPFLLSIFDTDLRFDVQSDGDDIAFSHNNVWLDHEIEVFDQTFNGTHAKLVVWVRLSVLSVTIDTIMRMYYGNSTMSSQQNPEGVWDSNYEAVYHMNQDPSSSSGICLRRFSGWSYWKSYRFRGS